MYFSVSLILVVALFTVLALTQSAFKDKLFLSLILPLLSVAAMIVSRVYTSRKREGLAFICSSLGVVFFLASFFVVLFPNVMISTLGAANNLTIYTASSSPYTLKIMSIIAAIMVPVVLAYQVWTYIVFKKRVKADPKTLTY